MKIKKLTEAQKAIIAAFFLGVEATYHLLRIAEEFDKAMKAVSGKEITDAGPDAANERSGHGGTSARETSPDGTQRAPGWPRDSRRASV